MILKFLLFLCYGLLSKLLKIGQGHSSIFLRGKLYNVNFDRGPANLKAGNDKYVKNT